jgi:hypothetical protein
LYQTNALSRSGFRDRHQPPQTVQLAVAGLRRMALSSGPEFVWKYRSK